MKRYLKYSGLIIFFCMIVANGYIFVSSIHLSDQINHFEKDLALLNKENQNLENKAYKIDSLQYAQKIAPSLSFTEPIKPLYLTAPNYALKP